MSRILMMAVLTISACLMSCGETIVIGNTDTPAPKPEPTPSPTPTPTPETVVKATDLLKEAQKEGTTIAFWFYYEGDLYNVVFKKVGDEYVFQNGGNCSQASTRTDWILDDSNTIKGLGGTVEFNDLEKLLFGVNVGGSLVLAAQISASTGDVFQRTFSANTYLAAMAVSNENTNMDNIMDMVRDLLLNKTSFNPDNKDLGQMMLVTADDDTGQLVLQTPGEIVANGAEQGMTAEESVGAALDNCKQKVAEDYEDGTSKIVETKFEDENPSVTWSPDPSKNTYQQELQTTGEDAVTYKIIGENCGAEIDAKSGKVTFEKPGEVEVEAVFKDTNGFVLVTSYTLTVNKAAGSISYTTTTVEKLTTDAAFTNALTIVGDGQVTYSSDKETVATVDENGQVTIKGAGEATITATVKDSKTYAYATKTATYQITVTAATVAVTGVSLNKTELDLYIGGSETLTATVAPTDASNKTVTWKSSKESVATVDANGKVTAVGAGEATITAKAGEKTAECKVTVKKVAGSISYADDKQTVTKNVDDAAFTNTLTIVGDGKVTYSSDKTSVATVDENGKVTIKGVGEATITATVADSDTYTYATKTASYKLTVKALPSTVGKPDNYGNGGKNPF